MQAEYFWALRGLSRPQ